MFAKPKPKPEENTENPAPGEAVSEQENAPVQGSDVDQSSDDTAEAEQSPDNSEALKQSDDQSGPDAAADDTQEAPALHQSDNPQELSVGRIVHFVAADGKKIQPAMVVQIWGNDCANLNVFRDGTNDTQHDSGGSDLVVWKTSVPYSAEKEPNTWHWPERV